MAYMTTASACLPDAAQQGILFMLPSSWPDLQHTTLEAEHAASTLLKFLSASRKMDGTGSLAAVYGPQHHPLWNMKLRDH